MGWYDDTRYWLHVFSLCINIYSSLDGAFCSPGCVIPLERCWQTTKKVLNWNQIRDSWYRCESSIVSIIMGIQQRTSISTSSSSSSSSSHIAVWVLKIKNFLLVWYWMIIRFIMTIMSQYSFVFYILSFYLINVFFCCCCCKKEKRKLTEDRERWRETNKLEEMEHGNFNSTLYLLYIRILYFIFFIQLQWRVSRLCVTTLTNRYKFFLLPAINLSSFSP